MTTTTKPTIDPKLPVFTRDGRPVQIITTEGRHPDFPIIGYVGVERGTTCWAADGAYVAQSSRPHPLDLVQHREVWVNIYDESFLAVFPTKEAAQRSTKTPVARIRVPYTPGQFDD